MSPSSWFRRFYTTYLPACGAKSPRERGQKSTYRHRRGFHSALCIESLESRQLLAADGGAALVADIVPGPASSNPSDLVAVNERLFFLADDGLGNRGLWSSDGTTADTKLVKNGPTGPADFASRGGEVFFTWNGLWKTDGTEAGTSQVIEMAARNVTAVGNTLYFAGDLWGTNSKGIELWKSDGTAAGTNLVKDIYSGTSKDGGRSCSRNCGYPNSSAPQGLVDLNGKLLFSAVDAKHGRELWISDGTSRGTKLVKDITAGSGSSNPKHLVQFEDRVYFGAAGGLWVTDGTKNGTVLVKELPNSPSYLTDTGNALFFTLGATGSQLWKSDGTAAGTVLVEDLGFGPENLTNVNGRLYFTGNDGAHGDELWQHDTVTGKTDLVMDIYPGSDGSSPDHLAAMNGKLYFAATEPVHGRELWDPPPVGSTGSDYLLVTSYDTDSVIRYDARTGQFVDTFVPKFSGGMNRPYGAVIGPDGNLYVTSGQFGAPGQLQGVLRYDGKTGAFIDEFAGVGQLANPRGLIFGPDGDLYVADHSGGSPAGRVLRYDGDTGEYKGDFVPAGEDGPQRPQGLLFGPHIREGAGDSHGKLDLYVGSAATHSVRRYDGTTGEFLGEFVTSGSGGIVHPTGMTLGPDGHLYVANYSLGQSDNAVFRYQGPTEDRPGAFIDRFVPVGSGGLESPFGVLFGPDGNGDGIQDLYVTSAKINTQSYYAYHDTSSVKRYDGRTGAFIDTFVGAGSGGLDNPSLMAFRQTDPVTLAYVGDNLRAKSIAETTTADTLVAEQAVPILAEALSRLENAGFDTSRLQGVDLHIADLPGAMIGRASGDTVWLDSNAAGWGWFIDPTPEDDTEFLMPGDQGERDHLDLLSAITHELSHLFGNEHDEEGLMSETLDTGERLLLSSHPVDASSLDLILATFTWWWSNEVEDEDSDVFGLLSPLA